MRGREKSTDRGESVVKTDKSKRENKTEGVTRIIASTGAITSFIFTHYEVFLFHCRILNRGANIPPRYGLSV